MLRDVVVERACQRTGHDGKSAAAFAPVRNLPAEHQNHHVVARRRDGAESVADPKQMAVVAMYDSAAPPSRRADRACCPLADVEVLSCEAVPCEVVPCEAAPYEVVLSGVAFDGKTPEAEMRTGFAPVQQYAAYADRNEQTGAGCN